MFDNVYVSKEVLKQYNVKCLKCNKDIEENLDFQTKDFECCLESYFLRHAEGQYCDDYAEYCHEPFIVKLYKLDPPCDQRYWYKYTDQENKEWEAKSKNSKFPFLFMREKDSGYWLPEAFFPSNRRQRDMGELPHRFVNLYAHCPNCTTKDKYAAIELDVKFTDGVVQDIIQKDDKDELE